MDLLACSEKDLAEIYELYNIDRKKLDRDVKEVLDWVRTQPHLPHHVQTYNGRFKDEDFINIVLGHSGFKVELAKKRIEKHFTYKRMYKELFASFSNDNFVMPSENCVFCVPLPKLGPGKERIRVGGLKSSSADDFDLDHIIQMFIFCFEMASCMEYVNRSLFVMDCKSASMEFLKHMDVSKIIKATTLIHEAYVTRVYGIHLLNVSPAIQFVFSIMKTAVGGPLFKRIYTHDSLESLHRELPKEYLPIEYGGTQGSIQDLIKKSDILMDEMRPYIINSVSDEFLTDESKRPGGGVVNNNTASTFGMDIFF